MEITLLGITDDVTECSCCGKQNLKCTVAFEIDGNETYFGTTCATHFYGKAFKDIKAQIETDKARRTREATERLRSTPEYVAYDSALRALEKDFGTPGHYDRRKRIIRPLRNDLDRVTEILKKTYRLDYLRA